MQKKEPIFDTGPQCSNESGVVYTDIYEYNAPILKPIKYSHKLLVMSFIFVRISSSSSSFSFRLQTITNFFDNYLLTIYILSIDKEGLLLPIIPIFAITFHLLERKMEICKQLFHFYGHEVKFIIGLNVRTKRSV